MERKLSGFPGKKVGNNPFLNQITRLFKQFFKVLEFWSLNIVRNSIAHERFQFRLLIRPWCLRVFYSIFSGNVYVFKTGKFEVAPLL